MRITFTQPDDVMYEVDQRRAIIVSDAEYTELVRQIIDGDPIRAELERECDELRERLAALETSADYWSATAPGGSLIADLKNTIVSQAREIARLKGEGE